VLPDKLGGVFAVVRDLFRIRSAGALPYAAILTRNTNEDDTRAPETISAADASVVHQLPRENIYAVLRRLRAVVGDEPGVLVANDWLELALAHWTPLPRAVVSIVHGDSDYYYALAQRHDSVIDAYVANSTHVRDRLRALLPHRQRDVHLIRHGVPTRTALRGTRQGPLRLLFSGRLHVDKGIDLLPKIDRRLQAMGIEVVWTVCGDGPHADRLHADWTDGGERVEYRQWCSIDESRRLAGVHDVFVLPSRSEGLPVSLLEAGAAGVVPVVSDLPSGIPEVVIPKQTGYRIPLEDVEGFATAIATLARSRETLAALSGAVQSHVSENFDIRKSAVAYEQLFSQWEQLRRPRVPHLRVPYGSRLDRPWIPNPIVRAIRKGM
jgi:glycosyltransferase involved in cell wall biosynthesis